MKWICMICMTEVCLDIYRPLKTIVIFASARLMDGWLTQGFFDQQVFFLDNIITAAILLAALRNILEVLYVHVCVCAPGWQSAMFRSLIWGWACLLVDASKYLQQGLLPLAHPCRCCTWSVYHYSPWMTATWHWFSCLFYSYLSLIHFQIMFKLWISWKGSLLGAWRKLLLAISRYGLRMFGGFWVFAGPSLRPA